MGQVTCPTSVGVANKVVVVTGCDTGVGMWVAREALTWGYKVVAGCLSPESPGGKFLSRCGATVLKLDVTDPLDVHRLAATVQDMQEHGTGYLNCLVNNAGVLNMAPLEWQLSSHVTTQLRVNLEGTLLVTHALLPFIRENRGRVINVSSPQGLVGTPRLSVYCASKWGVEGFTAALRREVATFGVKVVLVRPCNLPHKTGIIKNNGKALVEMRANIRPLTLKCYARHIDEAIEEFRGPSNQDDDNSQDFDPTTGDPYLMECFRQAMTALEPCLSYTAAPLLVRAYLRLLPLLPAVLEDAMLASSIHTTILGWARP